MMILHEESRNIETNPQCWHFHLVSFIDAPCFSFYLLPSMKLHKKSIKKKELLPNYEDVFEIVSITIRQEFIVLVVSLLHY